MSRFDKAANGWDHSDRRQAMAADIAGSIIGSGLLKPHMHILDFGAGTGLLTRHLVPYVRKMTALDLSQKMLEQLSQNAHSWEGASIELVHSDIIDYRTETKLDGIVSSMSMHHVQDLDALFQNFARLLKPQGFIAIADLKREDGTFHSDGNAGVYHFGFEEARLFAVTSACGFSKISFKSVHQVTKENGKVYPLFLMLAIKS